GDGSAGAAFRPPVLRSAVAIVRMRESPPSAETGVLPPPIAVGGGAADRNPGSELPGSSSRARASGCSPNSPNLEMELRDGASRWSSLETELRKERRSSCRSAEAVHACIREGEYGRITVGNRVGGRCRTPRARPRQAP